MAEDVVKDVGFGQVLELLARPHDDGGRKASLGKTPEEVRSGNEAGDRHGVPPGERVEALVHEAQVRHRVLLQSDARGALEKQPAARALQLAHATGVQQRPHLVILRCIGIPLLRREEVACGLDGCLHDPSP